MEERRAAVARRRGDHGDRCDYSLAWSRLQSSGQVHSASSATLSTWPLPRKHRPPEQPRVHLGGALGGEPDRPRRSTRRCHGNGVLQHAQQVATPAVAISKDDSSDGTHKHDRYQSLDLGRIDAFMQVARAGSISAAAEALFVSQPAVTARIQALEREVERRALHPRTARQPPDRGGTRPPAARRTGAGDPGPRRRGGRAGPERGGGTADHRRGAGGEHLRAAGHAPSVPADAPRRAPLGAQRALGGGARDGAPRGVEIGLMRPDPASRDHQPPSSTRTSWCWWCIAATRSPRRGQIRMAQMATEHLILFDRTSSYHELTSAHLPPGRHLAARLPRGGQHRRRQADGGAAAGDRPPAAHQRPGGDRHRAPRSRCGSPT